MEEDFEKHKLNIDQYLDEEEEEENLEEKIKTHWNPLLIKSAVKGDLETIKKCLEKGANIFYEEKKWNALIWACSKGNTDMVRYLLERGAGKPYLYSEEKYQSPYQSQTARFAKTSHDFFPATEKPERKIGQGVINHNARPTPLQWACFKGHANIVCLLLKEGLDLLETDTFGNNAIHQAVSGGSVEVVEVLLQFGVKIDYKNNRGHTVFDLCTEPKIFKYLREYDSTTTCPITNKKFMPGDIKYLCIITGRFYSAEASEIHWLYVNKDSEEAEKLERRSSKAQEEVQKIENELVDLISSYNYEELSDKIHFIQDHNIHVGVKLMDKAYIHQEKLRTQIHINECLDSHREVDNYKTIKKSINIIQEMISDAKNRKVYLDEEVVLKSHREMDRLEAERNLRFVLDNSAVDKATPEEVERISELKQIAVDKGVALKYCEEQEDVLEKMRKNIEANKIIQNFCAYPVRDWYPPPYYLDPKSKRPMDSVTKKAINPILLVPPPVKKKGKKAPKYVLPDWAVDTTELGKAIKRLEELLLQAKDIQLSEELLSKTTAEMDRMKKEWRYRKVWDEEAKILAEKKAKDAKKKK